MNKQVLAAASQAIDTAANEFLFYPGFNRPTQPGLPDDDFVNAAADKIRFDAATSRLDFRQLGHNDNPLATASANSKNQRLYFYAQFLATNIAFKKNPRADYKL